MDRDDLNFSPALATLTGPGYDIVRKQRIESRRRKVIHPPSVTRPNLVNNLSELFRYRDLLYSLSIHRIRVRYKQTALGITWAILQPLCIMLLFTLIFSFIIKMPSEGAPYAVFSYIAILPWTFFSTSLATGANSLLSNPQLVTKVYFPREILPLTYLIAALFDLVIASSVLIGLLIYYRIPATINCFYALPVIVILSISALATALFLSAMQIRFRDISLAMPLLLQIWMFATPVIYPLSAVPMRLRPYYLLNPIVIPIDSLRRAVLYGSRPDIRGLAISGLVSVALLAGAYIYFKRAESTMADIL